MRMFVTVVLTAAFAGCTSEDPSRKALESAGYSQIELKGWSAFGCGEGDTFHTKFEAVNPRGARVSGVVCCGWLKGCTIRY